MEATTNGQPHPRDDNWIPACFGPNQRRFPPAELLQYAGKYIAWSWEGTHIVAAADSNPELVAKVKSLGINPSRVVYDYVDLPGVFSA